MRHPFVRALTFTLGVVPLAFGGLAATACTKATQDSATPGATAATPGAAAGGGGGTALVLGTRGKAAEIPARSLIQFKVTRPVEIVEKK